MLAVLLGSIIAEYSDRDCKKKKNYLKSNRRLIIWLTKFVSHTVTKKGTNNMKIVEIPLQ